MIDSTSKLTAAAPEPPVAPVQPAAVAANANTSSRAQPATRLLVEADGAQGYVYRLVDTVTGRLLAELPRERVAELTSRTDYEAGALVSTSV